MTTPVQRAKDGSYTHPLTGETYPGVSTCIGVLAKPALIGWAAKVTAAWAVEHRDKWEDLDTRAAIDLIKGASRRDSGQAGDLGSAVHHAAETWIKTGEKPHVSSQVVAYLERLEQFLVDWRPYWVLCEATVYSFQHGYAGTLDAVVELEGLGPVLLDIKTGRSGVWPEAGMQMAAYRHADEAVLGPPWRKCPMPKTNGAVVLHLRPDRYQLIPVRADQPVFEAFLRARALYTYRQIVEPGIVLRPLSPPKPAERTAADV